MLAVALDCMGSSPTSSVAEKRSKRPFTLATIRWRTTNSTLECTASASHVPAVGNCAPSTSLTASVVAIAVSLVVMGGEQGGEQGGESHSAVMVVPAAKPGTSRPVVDFACAVAAGARVAHAAKRA